jgi:hypothetical protein
MGRLFVQVKAAIRAGRVLVSEHADEMLRERSLAGWQAVSGCLERRPLIERSRARPNPVVGVDQTLADGASCKAVWAYISAIGAAKLVTVHFYDR